MMGLFSLWRRGPRPPVGMRERKESVSVWAHGGWVALVRSTVPMPRRRPQVASAPHRTHTRETTRPQVVAHGGGRGVWARLVGERGASDPTRLWGEAASRHTTLCPCRRQQERAKEEKPMRGGEEARRPTRNWRTSGPGRRRPPGTFHFSCPPLALHRHTWSRGTFTDPFEKGGSAARP